LGTHTFFWDLLRGFAPSVLLCIWMIASITLLCCALAGYLEVWSLSDQQAGPTASLFVTNWFFYLNASVSIMTLFGLLLYI
jgi:hypothetical protein